MMGPGGLLRHGGSGVYDMHGLWPRTEHVAFMGYPGTKRGTAFFYGGGDVLYKDEAGGCMD